MSLRSTLLKTGIGMGAAAAAAVATGVVVEHRVVKTRRAAAQGADRLSVVHSDPLEVKADDGTILYAEVDEVAPYAGKGRHRGATAEPGVTLVFVHGYALNLDCWHFQRTQFRGKYRMAFYDQRSHGRSERSPRGAATIDQLGDDLAAVIQQLAPDGKVVLVGHSMGGMSIMALAEGHPDLFAERVAGVALIATTAGGLHPHRILGRLIPDGVGELAAPRVVAALASAPELVDSARRRGSNIGFLVADTFAFGERAPVEEVEFLDEMLAGTPMSVIGEFFPNFSTLDKFAALGRVDAVPTTVIGGTKDRIISIGHCRKLASRMPNARLVEVEGAGHMVIFEARDQVNAEIEDLVARSLT